MDEVGQPVEKAVPWLAAKLVAKAVPSASPVTRTMIDAKIAKVRYAEPESSVVSVCVITMQNGYYVTGVGTSARGVDAARMSAYQNAYRQLWPLEHYLLCERRATELRASEPDDVAVVDLPG